MMKCLAFLVLLMMAPQVANAQQAAPAGLKLVNDCLNNADKNGKLGTSCIGLIADPCRAKTNNDTDKNRACAARELAVWNAILETAGKHVRAGGFKEITKALADSEKAWTAQREVLCPTFDKIEPGFLPGDANYCRMQITANRALLLRKLGAGVNPH
jgi:uncharacterized protein YecT (DUF1311 family)